MLFGASWKLFRRLVMQSKIDGFRADISTDVDRESKFERMCALHGNTVVVNSVLGFASYAVDAKIINTEIGKYCSIGPGSRIGGLGRHPVERLSTHPAFYTSGKQTALSFFRDESFQETARTYLGNDVWIGASVIVLDGVVIGDGAVIAAGSVVVKDVPPFQVWGGVPAKKIKSRKSPEEILWIESDPWWNWSTEKILANSELFLVGVEERDQIISRQRK
jgi:chloramphenicol O-acetyltransferase type B